MNRCRSTLEYPKLRNCFSSQSIASRLRCVPCIRSPNWVSPLMCALYRSNSRRPTTVRTGAEGAFAVWPESPAAKTNVPSRNRISVSFPDGPQYYFQNCIGALHLVRVLNRLCTLQEIGG